MPVFPAYTASGLVKVKAFLLGMPLLATAVAPHFFGVPRLFGVHFVAICPVASRGIQWLSREDLQQELLC